MLTIFKLITCGGDSKYFKLIAYISLYFSLITIYGSSAVNAQNVDEESSISIKDDELISQPVKNEQNSNLIKKVTKFEVRPLDKIYGMHYLLKDSTKTKDTHSSDTQHTNSGTSIGTYIVGFMLAAASIALVILFLASHPSVP